jgi:Protein of unknown function (DUF1573)
MKKIILILLGTSLIFACKNDEVKKDKNAISADMINNPRTGEEGVTENLADLGTLTFKDTLHDFGTIKEGVVVEHDFEYTNTGKRPVLISEAHASCGCTVPDYSQDPIAVGATGILKVKFNTTGKEGANQKSVMVTNNGNPGFIKIFITANVEKK